MGKVQTLAVVAATVVMSASGCVCVTEEHVAARGDVTFLWSFERYGCALVPGVAQVALSIDGQTLDNGGRYLCNTAGTDGIKLLDFRPGTYSYVIQGLSNSGVVLYEASGTFGVDGNVTVHVDLKRASAALGAAAITWRFPGAEGVSAPTCAQTIGPVSAVHIRVDDDTRGQEFNCSDGDVRANPNTGGIVFPDLVAGTHTIALYARDDRGAYYYRYTGTFEVQPGMTTANELTFAWNAGSLPLRWSFSNGAAQLDCAQAGVGAVQVTVRDSAQKDSVFNDIPCTTGGVQGALLPYLPEDTYSIYISATAAGGTVYSTDFYQPPTASVVGGQFPAVTSATPIYLLAP